MPERITKQYIAHLNLIAKGSMAAPEMARNQAINKLTDIADRAIPPTGPNNPVAEHLRAQAKEMDREPNTHSSTYRLAADEIERLHNGWGRANEENSDLRRGRSTKPADNAGGQLSWTDEEPVTSDDDPVTADGKSHIYVAPSTYPTREDRDKVARMANELWQAHARAFGSTQDRPDHGQERYFTVLAEAAIQVAQHERDHEPEDLPEPYYIRRDALRLAVQSEVSNPLEAAEDFRTYLEGRS